MKDIRFLKICLNSCEFGLDNKNRQIKLDNYFDGIGNTLNSVGPLAKINLFVGANNSGKSRFLRALAQVSPIRFQTADFPHAELAIGLNTILEQLDKHKHNRQNDYIVFEERDAGGMNSYKAEDGGKHLFSLKENFNDVDFAYFNPSRTEKAQDFNHFTEWIKKYSLMNYTTRDAYNREPGALFQRVNQVFASNPDVIPLMEKFLEAESSLDANIKRCYVPILRSLNRFDENTNKHEAEVFFEKRLRKLYFQGENSKGIEIFTGQSFYHVVQGMLLGDRSQRDKIRAFEKFLSVEFFEEKEVTLVPNINDDVVYVKIGDEDDTPIYHLGDAIQNLIILTFPIFENKDDKTLFFIEEPEAHLHPSMQRKFMEVLQKTDYPHQFFITTHSNHLLDLTLDHSDISIFSFRKQIQDVFQPIFYVTNTQRGDESILSLLGVQSSSVFLSNATIWVEGITDRKYIRTYLELYLDWLKTHHESKFLKIEEDLDFAFIEYSGGNIAHWSFLDDSEFENIAVADSKMRAKRITRNIFLIADQDGKDKKLERKAELRAVLGERFCLLKCKEVENLLSPDVIKCVIQHHERKKDSAYTISLDFSQADYKDRGLGDFIHNEIFKGTTPNRKGGYTAESGTLRSNVKEDFCNRAVSEINWNNMSDEAKRLARKIYKFILSIKFPGQEFDELPSDVSVEEPEDTD